MRNAFAKEITELAEQDPRVVLLSGDIGNRLFDEFKERHPDRFYNCGVAEANMMGMAAGLAMSGLRPVVYTITPFVTTRCLEQIRVDVCYHNVPVTVVAVGAGLAYASLGPTHHACEDISFLRSLPHMQVVCPGDAIEVKHAMRAALAEGKPCYVRLGKKKEPIVHETEDIDFTIGKGITIREGEDVCLLSTGNILPVAVETADRLAAEGVSARVVSFHTVKPLDEACLAKAFDGCRVVATMEEHSRIGGLGGAVAEWLVDGPQRAARLLRFGTPDEFLHFTGSQTYARERTGLSADYMATQIGAAITNGHAAGTLRKSA